MKLLVLMALALVFVGCTSAKLRNKTKQRDRLAQDKGFYCDTVNSDEAESVEVELNLQMAQKCDPSKPHSISHYKNDSGESQVIYCCSVVKGALTTKIEKPKKKMSDKKMDKKSKTPKATKKAKP